MKLFLTLFFISFGAFAQYYPFPGERNFPFPGRYPYPDFPRFPEDYCSSEQIRTTTESVKNVCEAKMTEFSAEHDVTCEIKKVSLNGCKALCSRDEVTYAKLRMDVNSNCRNKSARLRKTVITYYY